MKLLFEYSKYYYYFVLQFYQNLPIMKFWIYLNSFGSSVGKKPNFKSNFWSVDVDTSML